MRLKNPTTFTYAHPNFGVSVIESSLNDVGTDEATLVLEVKAPDGRAGEAKLQMQDTGDVVIRVHRNAANPIRVLVVGDSGTLYEG